jgi:hypothetical protein
MGAGQKNLAGMHDWRLGGVDHELLFSSPGFRCR